MPHYHEQRWVWNPALSRSCALGATNPDREPTRRRVAVLRYRRLVSSPAHPVHRALVALALTLALGGCERCASSPGSTSGAASSAAPLPSAKALLPPAAPWRFAPLRGIPTYALPEGCALREPVVVAEVAPTTRFVASPHELGRLVIADAKDDDLTQLARASAVSLDPDGGSDAPETVPWFSPAAMPRTARPARGGTLSAVVEALQGSTARVVLFHDQRGEELARGDQLDAVDLGCSRADPDRCVLLTSRAERVWAPGADVWLGRPGDPPSAWRRVTIAPSRPDSDAFPSGLAQLDPPIAALVEGRELVFYAVPSDASPPRELARLAAPYRAVLDAIAAPTPLALVRAAPMDEEGCSSEGGKMRVERAGKPGVELTAPTPPISAALRRLARGYLASWLAPLSCDEPRTVVYAVVLDEDGAPTSSPMPVSDAESYAVAADGARVDAWVQSGETVTWLRARCEPSGAPR